MQKDVKRGEIYFVKASGEPVVGSEQGGCRPAVIISNDIGNKCATIVEVVYLTTQGKKRMPTHARVNALEPSVALCEQIQTISKERLAERIGRVTKEEEKEINKALFVSLFMGKDMEKLIKNKR